MKRLFLCVCGLVALLTGAPAMFAQAAAETPAASSAEADQAAKTTAAAAAQVVSKPVEVRPPDFLEHIVDEVLHLFDVRSSGNTATHFAIAAVFLVAALLLRRVVTTILFNYLKKLASKTTTTLDDKLFPALEGPVGTFIMLVGIFAALKVLKLSETNDRAIAYGSTIAFSLVLFWGLLRAFSAILDHAQEIALRKQVGVAAFMPWIKKTLVALFVVLGVLLTAQSLGFEVKTFLAGLGIGGLAFALAAQDTIANLFGSIVVAIDQPFKIGEAVKIGSFEGNVEDIGLRSTKLRTPAQNLIIIPNKTVAAEAVVNNSRFIRRRVEQVLNLTYDTTPDQMTAIVEEIRRVILAEPEVDPTSVMVYFRDLSASSLDIWVVYVSKDPDFNKHMRLRQRLNLAFMRVVEKGELAFAFPTQVIQLDGAIAKQLAEKPQRPT